MNSALYVRRFSLNLMRDLIGDQCSDLSRCLDSESLLDIACHVTLVVQIELRFALRLMVLEILVLLYKRTIIGDLVDNTLAIIKLGVCEEFFHLRGQN